MDDQETEGVRGEGVGIMDILDLERREETSLLEGKPPLTARVSPTRLLQLNDDDHPDSRRQEGERVVDVEYALFPIFSWWFEAPDKKGLGSKMVAVGEYGRTSSSAGGNDNGRDSSSSRSSANEGEL